ncbi:serine hydrolase [Paenibacillus agaridevorans]|uniref:Serine hydrolase n=1 Tax=Paenibacillus agaridevorans TaxID=171404 RepID=A0A2R5EUM3_9BACL|nr:serine hydrolase [Paenibacillus agaridevorans]GBG09379.1 serine hydrolase [Paenibacillus agaridevorans]
MSYLLEKGQWRDWQITSVIVHKGDRKETEWHEGGEDAIGPLYSCTKSVLSALIGIAVDRGDLPGVDEPIDRWFQRYAAGGGDDSWGQITIKQLLTMTPGFEWPDFDKPYWELRKSRDPVAYALNQPLVHLPGHAFTYNSGGSHLLSAILTEATGKSALQYAREHLFEPLGFRAAKWSERGGISEGGTGLALTGNDLVKFGVLYLKEGLWDGKRILSTSWISDSTTMHHRALLHYEPPIYGGFGYHWWCTPSNHNGVADGYFAFGHGGQYLMIVPELDTVIMVRKRITKRNEAIWSRKLIFDIILPGLLRT